jgi:hypothetical protein
MTATTAVTVTSGLYAAATAPSAASILAGAKVVPAQRLCGEVLAGFAARSTCTKTLCVPATSRAQTTSENLPQAA